MYIIPPLAGAMNSQPAGSGNREREAWVGGHVRGIHLEIERTSGLILPSYLPTFLPTYLPTLA